MKTKSRFKLRMSGVPPKDGRMIPLAATILAIIEREIIWCEQNPDKAFSADYRKGFINGLVQARLLITEAEKLLRKESSNER